MTSGLRLAVAHLTRWPVGGPPRLGEDDLGRAVVWFPLVGALVGGLTGAVFWVAQEYRGFGMPATVAVAALAVSAMLSGAIHERGLAASFDGLAGGWTPEERLRILREGRLGTHGALALVLVSLLKWSALLKLGSADSGWTGFVALVAAHGLGRAAAGLAFLWVPPARVDGVGPARGGLAATLGMVTTAAALAALTAFVPTAEPTLPVVVVGGSTVVAALVIAWGQRRIGGRTLDVTSAAEQLVEVAVLALVARTI